MNLIKNNNLQSVDVDLAERTFGPDIGSLKAKSTRNKPAPVQSNVIDILEEFLEVNLNSIYKCHYRKIIRFLYRK